MSTWAVLVAAGRGERLGGDRPKAFAPLGGRPLLAESLERLEASEWIDAIVVVAPDGWGEPSILVAEELGCGKVVATVTGGPSRAESVRLGVAEAPEDAVALVVHANGGSATSTEGRPFGTFTVRCIRLSPLCRCVPKLKLLSLQWISPMKCHGILRSIWGY